MQRKTSVVILPALRHSAVQCSREQRSTDCMAGARVGRQWRARSPPRPSRRGRSCRSWRTTAGSFPPAGACSGCRWLPSIQDLRCIVAQIHIKKKKMNGSSRRRVTASAQLWVVTPHCLEVGGWTQNTHNSPMLPTSRPLFLMASGMARIPVPMFPFSR